VIWNDEADALLIKLWNEGGSLGHVAKGMVEAGYVVTRNAVAGRRHRIMPEAFTRKGSSTKVVKTRARPRQRSKPVENKSKILRKQITVSDVEAIATNPGIEYLELEGWQCRAIIDGPRTGPWKLNRVCGLPRVDGESYCRGHLKLYTNPVPAQRRA